MHAHVPPSPSHVTLETPVVQSVDVLEDAILVTKSAVRTSGSALRDNVRACARARVCVWWWWW
jgi:hypothetical protein